MVAIKAPSEASVSHQLVARILDGDLSAEREMVERYQRGLGVMLFNRARDRELANDIAQDTWVLVLQKIRDNQLRDQSKLAAFIIQIAKNQLIMRMRSRAKQQFVTEDEVGEMRDPGLSPDKMMVNEQLGECVTSLMGELKVDRDRQILQRFYLVGDDKDALCEEFGLSHAHFDRVLYRARERFKSLWHENVGKR
ncbi:RNA polymerase sigma factor [Arenicella xantha]|uniref:RNA polymerase sigma-70 factor (ECF subfamily) n=1 Tax=Arenicella xantha TaxID=644221 RepID=A0A395JGU9_9GAMM|nr:sigma-70 family RNA polymerase sigma factor [Arenicella xantha]RBP49136.1 RNA polymerase sigma-70 factor (ECF subfamily) [Arenicella xantha]